MCFSMVMREKLIVTPWFFSATASTVGGSGRADPDIDEGLPDLNAPVEQDPRECGTSKSLFFLSTVIAFATHR
jgi:hypothetical protein